MALLNANPIPSDRFHYDAKSKTLITDASDLGWQPGELRTQSLYDDSIDEGIVLLSSVSNQPLSFYLRETKKTDEGDVIAWEFAPVMEAVARNTKLRGLSVIILND